MKALLAVSTVVALAFSSVAVADDHPTEEIVVTATRTATPISRTLAPVSVLTEADIQRLQPVDLIDLFNHLPGVDVTRSGSMGSTSSLFMRGTNSDHTLFLVDGQRINSASLGSTNFQFLDPSQIERIEVVRGARSSVYGSDAIGGVIQIFTKKGSGAPHASLSTEIGSNDTQRVAASVGGARENFRYAFDASYLDTDGIDNRLDDTGTNRDHDGYRNRSFNGSIGYRFANDVDVSLSLLQANARNYYDGSSVQDLYQDSWIQNIAFKLDAPLADWWHTRISLGESVDDGDNIDAHTGINTGDYRTVRESVSWQNDFTVVEGQLVTLGFDYYNDDLDSRNAYQDSSGKLVSDRYNRATFAQYQGTYSIFDIMLGIREDDDEAFGTHTTGNLAMGIQVDDQHRVVLSWAEGFKAPTFNDLYYPFSGNPNLEPEESENYEIDVSGYYAVWNWQLSLYQNKIDNLIQWAPDGSGFWFPFNVAAAKIKGAELVIGACLGEWDISTSLSYTDPRDDDTDKVLISRAKKSLLVDVGRDFGRWDIGASLNVRSERFLDTANNDSLGGYSLLDVRFGYDVTPRLKAQLKVNNILDKSYRTNGSSWAKYNEDDANWMLKLTYSI